MNKRIISLLLCLVLMLGMLPLSALNISAAKATATSSSAYAKEIIIANSPDIDLFSENYDTAKTLVLKDGNYIIENTARIAEYKDGVLTLNNYDRGMIRAVGGDLTIKVVGENKINHNLLADNYKLYEDIKSRHGLISADGDITVIGDNKKTSSLAYVFDKNTDEKRLSSGMFFSGISFMYSKGDISLKNVSIKSEPIARTMFSFVIFACDTMNIENSEIKLKDSPKDLSFIRADIKAKNSTLDIDSTQLLAKKDGHEFIDCDLNICGIGGPVTFLNSKVVTDGAIRNTADLNSSNKIVIDNSDVTVKSGSVICPAISDEYLTDASGTSASVCNEYGIIIKNDSNVKVTGGNTSFGACERSILIEDSKVDVINERGYGFTFTNKSDGLRCDTSYYDESRENYWQEHYGKGLPKNKLVITGTSEVTTDTSYTPLGMYSCKIDLAPGGKVKFTTSSKNHLPLRMELGEDLKVEGATYGKLESGSDVIYIDGTTLTVTAADPVLEGEVKYNGYASYGSSLTANTDDLNTKNNTKLSYQWYRYKPASTKPSGLTHRPIPGSTPTISRPTAITRATATKIDGATEKTYRLTEADVGYYVFVKVTADGYDGSVNGAYTKIDKAVSFAAPILPTLKYSSGKITFTPEADQDYCWTRKAPDGSKDLLWPTDGEATNGSIDVTEGAGDVTFYVYTRKAATATTYAGYNIKATAVIVPRSASGTNSYITDVIYTDSGHNANIYIPVGKIFDLFYQTSPVGATEGHPTWKEVPISSAGSLITKITDDGKVLTIRAGEKVGETTVVAYKNEYERWFYGTDHSNDGRTINVTVFDPNDLTTIPITSRYTLYDIDIMVDETYEVDMEEIFDLPFVPDGANKYKFTYFTRTVYREETDKLLVGNTSEDDSISIDNNIITGVQAGSAKVYVFAMPDNTEPTDTNDRWIATFNINVSDKPEVTLDQIKLDQASLIMYVGDTMKLNAKKLPADATGELTWQSSDTTKLTVDESGNINALAEGKVDVTVKCDDVSATCRVEIKKTPCKTHTFKYIYQDANMHTAECTVCGYIATDAHDGVYIKKNETTHSKTCSKCTVPSGSTDAAHEWELDKVVSPAVGVKGSATYKCSVCDATKSEDIPALTEELEVPKVPEEDKKPEETTPPASSSKSDIFTDVPQGSYYKDAVSWAVDKNITNGMTETTFGPDGICTRAQAVTFLWRAAGSPETKSMLMPFTDVAAGSYYYKAVLWAVENGITNGTSPTTFSPDMNCTRAQIVTFLWRSQSSPKADETNPFTDVKSGAYYLDPVLWAVRAKVTNGMTDTTFGPDADCTRAQIVTFIYRALAK